MWLGFGMNKRDQLDPTDILYFSGDRPSFIYFEQMVAGCRGLRISCSFDIIRWIFHRPSKRKQHKVVLPGRSRRRNCDVSSPSRRVVGLNSLRTPAVAAFRTRNADWFIDACT